MNPLVAILSITYNHEPYIRDALEGFVMQKTDFPFVAIVHDDASTDGTAAIIREYAEKYPDIIRPIYETENQYSKRDGSLGRIMDKACEETGAKYIAMCEGDDYWTDPLKLQKQVDFLERHTEIAYTCHRFMVREKNNPELKLYSNMVLDRYPQIDGFEFNLKYNYLHEWVSKTLTAVFRADYIYKTSSILRKCKYYRDVHLVYHILSQGNGYCFNFIGGVYRKQETGVWSQLNLTAQIEIEIRTWEEIDFYLNSYVSKKKLENNYVSLYTVLIKNKTLPRIKTLKQMYYLISTPYVYLRNRICYLNDAINTIKNLDLNIGKFR